MKITLKSARINRGLLQSELSDKLGVYQETYSKWETGNKPIKEITKLAISYLLEMKCEEIEWPIVKTKDKKRKTLRK